MTEVEDGLVPQRDQSISYFGHTKIHPIASLRNRSKWLGKPPDNDLSLVVRHHESCGVTVVLHRSTTSRVHVQRNV